MSAACPFCGASLNFGLNFCVVCGRHTNISVNKMGGGLKGAIRQADTTRRIDDDLQTQAFKNKRRSLRFRKNIRTFSQTIFYGFTAGALFFCAVRFAIEALVPGGIESMPNSIHRVVAPFLEPILHFRHNSNIESNNSGRHASRTKHSPRPPRRKHHSY